jgi:hypothetical protein
MNSGKIIVILGTLLFVAGCATQPHVMASSETPGFLQGLFNGFTIFFSLVGSFFTDVRIYAFPNNGWPYDVGYLLGIAMFAGGSARSY